jgi:TPR repeat protein
MIKSRPAGVRLTAGRRVGADEWRVPAQDISHTAIIPPTDFVGEMNLPAELYTADGATLVTTFVRLTWASVQSDSTAMAAATSTAATPLAPVAAAPLAAVAPAPPPPQAMAPPSQAAAAVDTPQARAEPSQELSPNEVAALVRRAQELLASGDLPAARMLLRRAADAQSARAALLLAKTFDPITSRQLSTADPGPDLAQARNWYQRAKEWGSPEAQRQLDALASFPRR